MANNSLSFFMVIWVVLTCEICFSCSRGIMREEKRLLNDLLKDYDVDEKPVGNVLEILNVKLSLSYRQLLDLDEPTQTIKSLIWLKVVWKDAFLQWNASEYGGHSIIRVDPSRVWKPDLTLYNNIHEDGGDLSNFNERIKFTSDGMATWLAPTILHSVCILDISRFPFDTQKCNLMIGSWGYDGFALDLNIQNAKDPDISVLQRNTEWELRSADAQKNTKIYPCCAAPYYDITYTFYFQRKPLYYIMTIIAPCVVLLLLAAISFLFPADSGERISLVMSVLLGLVVFMLIINNKTPINSDSVPMITQFFNAIGFLIFLSLLATAVVLRMNHASAFQPVAGYLAKFRNLVAFVLCMKKDVFRKPTQLDLGEVLLINREQWLSFRDQITSVLTTRLTDEKILRELQKLSKRLEEQDFANEIKEDWKYTGRVLDKLFLFVFLVVFFSISVYVISFM